MTDGHHQKRVWQIAAGDSPNRDYGWLFLRYGLAAVGPGEPGPFDPETPDPAYESYAFRPFLEPFCSQMAIGDVLILKRPSGQNLWSIVAVGEVASDYTWEARLGDVEGWDLQHMRRVNWRRPAQLTIVAGLVRGTLKRVNKPELQALARRVWEAGVPVKAPAELPRVPEVVDDETVISTLMDYGISSFAAETVAQTLRRIRRLADWYANTGAELGEHEIRTFLVVPILQALGWPEQRMRIEYERVDIALWSLPFDHPAGRVVRVIETKRLYDALGDAPVSQATRYAEAQECHSIVVTDGFRWKLFERGVDEDGLGPWVPTAYADIRRLRDRHPLDQRVAGADKLFLNLLPATDF